jgi:hypothetical protein
MAFVLALQGLEPPAEAREKAIADPSLLGLTTALHPTCN